MRKRHLLVAAAILAVPLLPAPAVLAHNGGVSAGCNAGQPRAVVNLTSYNGTNTISVKADGGAELSAGTFGASYSATFPLGDPFVAHVVVYKVTAHDDPSNANGWSPGGTLNVPACQTPPPTTPAPTTTTSTTSTTSTTIAATTTTTAETTTSSTTPATEPPTTPAPTSSVAATVLDTTTTTTTVVAVCCPPVPPQGLPETGAPIWPQVLVALGCCVVGGGTIRLVRRRV